MFKNSFYTVNLRKILSWKYLYIAILVIAAALNIRPAAQLVFNTYTRGVQMATGQQRMLPIYSVDIPDPRISITFDAAWGADDTDTILQILADNNVRSTFFLCGYWVERYPDEVRKLVAGGHDVGNHGNTHAHGAQLSLEQNKAEIQGAHDKIRAITGLNASLFRPPYGEYNNTVISAAEALGYFTIQWDVDSHDWMNRGPEYQINRVLNHPDLQNGSIILFHNGARYTPQTLGTIIQGLRSKGFELVPISELIHTENFRLDHTGRQFLNPANPGT